MSAVSDFSQPYGEPPVLGEAFWRLSTEQFHEMVRQGIVTEDDPVEFLEGLLVAKMPISPDHRRATHRVQTALRAALPSSHYVGSPSPVTLAASEPEPDVVVARGTDDDYRDRHPGPADLALVVEVSDSTLRRDQNFKKAIYARSGIAVYWIVNLIDRRVEVYSEPSGAGDAADYRTRKLFAEGERVPLVIEGREIAKIAAADLLP